MCPVDWDDVENWGNRVHIGTTVADAHDTTEAAAEASRG